MSDLDKDFEVIANQINSKLQEAAKSLSEAAALAEKAGLPMLIASNFLWEELQYQNRKSEEPKTKEELLVELDKLHDKLHLIKVSPVESAMGQCGWSASSSYC